eukprot:1379745-Pyramimonas_sp.AAC.1
MAPPREQVKRVVVDVLTHKYITPAEKERERQERPRRANVNADDDPHAEDSRLHKEKMTKWAEVAVKALRDDRFWEMIEIAHETRRPLDHFAHFCAKKFPGNCPTSLAKLVWDR